MGDFVNSTQTRFDRAAVSCGVLQAHHLQKGPPVQTLFSIATALYHKANPRPSAFVLFSDVVGEGSALSRGQSLANTISKLGVAGTLIASPKEVNPRTGNVIQVWLLHLDHEKFRKWYQDELANRITEE